MDWFLKALKNYAGFSGRSRRKEYWYFNLFYVLFFMALAVADNLIGTVSAGAGSGLLSSLFTLALIIPSLAVLVRRLHDTGRSGWWFFISFIPLVGAIVLLVFMVLDSDPDNNDYGPNPKEGAL